MTSEHQSQPVLSRHIEFRKTRSGVEKAFLIGTRISVQNIYVCHELQGMTPDQIIEAYPHLTLPQVHAALSYFYEHADEIREECQREQALAKELEAQQAPTTYSRLRDAVIGGKDVVDPEDSLPS